MDQYNGLIAVWKEAGYTSHDVVAKMRRILHQKKIGHSGTLDPQATGVLAVGVGIGTKSFDLLPDKRKRYEAEITFGVETDTEDIWGTVLEEAHFSADEAAVREAIVSFEGPYEQIPPMYSAKKVDGKKLYQLAREGKQIERKPAALTIYEIKVLWIHGCKAAFEVECSAGTYIRTLCVDIGKKLNTIACMSSLTRINAGGFSREQAMTLSELEQLTETGHLVERIIPVEQALSHFPAVYAPIEYEKAIKNGNPIQTRFVSGMPSEPQWVRLFLKNDEFIGVYSNMEHPELLTPKKIFYRLGE